MASPPRQHRSWHLGFDFEVKSSLFINHIFYVFFRVLPPLIEDTADVNKFTARVREPINGWAASGVRATEKVCEGTGI
jgi:hypothetical protein